MNNKITIPITRLVPGLIIGPASWLGPYIVMNSLFLAAIITLPSSARCSRASAISPSWGIFSTS